MSGQAPLQLMSTEGNPKMWLEVQSRFHPYPRLLVSFLLKLWKTKRNTWPLEMKKATLVMKYFVLILFFQSVTSLSFSKGAIRKNQTFAGSLSDVIGHSDEAYPHVHHVMSRHRPHRPRKIIQEKAEKLPTLDEHEMRPIARAETEEETEGEKSPQPKGKLFSVGGDHEESDNDQDKNMDEEMRKRRKRRHKHHHKSHFTEDELELRRAKGSELAMERMDRIFQMEDDDEDLDMRDYEDLSHNRFDHLHAYERHKISSRKGSANFSIHGPTSVKDRKKMDKFMETLFPDEAAKEIDHTPHALFVEMDELINNEWVEQARWIKYEESREEGAERWGKPHVSSLSFHSLLNLRLHLERGVTMLDVEARDMTNLLFSIVEEFNLEGLLDDDLKSEVLRMLLFRHRYVDGDQNTGLTGIRRNLSHLSLHSRKNSAKDHATLAEEGRSPSQQSFGAQSLAQAMLSLGKHFFDLFLFSIFHCSLFCSGQNQNNNKTRLQDRNSKAIVDCIFFAFLQVTCTGFQIFAVQNGRILFLLEWKVCLVELSLFHF